MQIKVLALLPLVNFSCYKLLYMGRITKGSTKLGSSTTVDIDTSVPKVTVASELNPSLVMSQVFVASGLYP